MLKHKKERLDALQQLLADGEFRPSLPFARNSVSTGKLKPLVDSTYAFGDALQAYDKLMSQRARGKVIVTVDDKVQLESPPSGE